MPTASKRIVDGLRRERVILLALATVDANGDPRVRFVRGSVDEELTIRCPTFADTNKVQHVRGHSRVSVTCGDTDSSRPGTYFEIQGDARMSTDPRDRALAWGPQLEKWFSGPEDADYVVIVIRPTRIEALPIGGGPAAEVWSAG